MRILHLLWDGRDERAEDVARLQAAQHEVSIIDASSGDFSYEDIVEALFANDRVIAWSRRPQP